MYTQNGAEQRRRRQRQQQWEIGGRAKRAITNMRLCSVMKWLFGGNLMHFIFIDTTQLRIIIIVYHHFGWRILKRKGNENLDHAHVGGKKGRQKEADNDSRVSYCSMSTRWFSTELYVIASKHDSDLRYHTKWKNFGCNSSFSQLWNYTFALWHIHASMYTQPFNFMIFYRKMKMRHFMTSYFWPIELWMLFVSWSAHAYVLRME